MKENLKEIFVTQRKRIEREDEKKKQEKMTRTRKMNNFSRCMCYDFVESRDKAVIILFFRE